MQSVFEDVARDTNRGHTVAAVCGSFHLAKDCGFKVVTHMMPDLPNMGWERDLDGFREVCGALPCVVCRLRAARGGAHGRARHIKSNQIKCQMFENPLFRPDGLKIYPTLVIRGTGLYELWRTGAYRNYPPEQLVDLVARILSMVVR